MRGRLAAALAGVALLAGCVHRQVRLGERAEVENEAGAFALSFEPRDRAGVEMVRSSLLAAGPRLARWGRLETPVEVRVLPTHARLEEAVDRDDYDWLRAWARREVVFVQSPSTWFAEGTATQAQVDELLLHELTHCVMYQLASRGDEWRRKRIPVWFREGMASVTAGQGYRRGSLSALARLLAMGTGGELLNAPESLFRERSEAVYTAAHHGFAFLVRRYGDEAIKRILASMRGGNEFDAAFREAVGIAPESFEREFERYVRMEGWRTRPWLRPAVPPGKESGHEGGLDSRAR